MYHDTQVLVLLEWLEADSLKEQKRSVKMAFFTLKGRIAFFITIEVQATLKPLVSNRENTKLETIQTHLFTLSTQNCTLFFLAFFCLRKKPSHLKMLLFAHFLQQLLCAPKYHSICRLF